MDRRGIEPRLLQCHRNVLPLSLAAQVVVNWCLVRNSQARNCKRTAPLTEWPVHLVGNQVMPEPFLFCITNLVGSILAVDVNAQGRIMFAHRCPLELPID